MSTLLTKPTDVPAGVRDSAGRPTWGSDVVMDMLRLLDIEYASLLPGSSFGHIHDSAVNYLGNERPELILCNHEMITTAMARGYAKVTGKPMAVMLHNIVGLLNGMMTIYDAWCDRVPVLILGGTGPMDATQRKPWIHWIHTANLQGNFVRDFVKWDDQPGSVEAVPESMLRAYRIAVTEPQGPVYVCFDHPVQEQELSEPFQLPDVSKYRPAIRPQPDPGAIREAARLLVGAELPMAFADRVGRSSSAVQTLAELAELLAMPVIDVGARHNFPTPHALDFAGAAERLLGQADVVLGLDMVDLYGALRGPANPSRKVINVWMDELIHRSLTADYQALPAVDLPILGESSDALPLLLEECRRLIDASAQARIDRRRHVLEAEQQALRERQRRYMQEQWDRPQISEARLAAEVYQAVKNEDFIFTYGRVRRMAPGFCHLSGPEQYLGIGGGATVGAGPGVALGAALALKDSGKLPAATFGDGDFLMSVQALWTAAHYGIPGLWVLNNNRTYYNDQGLQIRIAEQRDRPPENAWVAQRIENPEWDYATIARGAGVVGVGPVKEASELQPALRTALEAVRQGQLAVVDVWTENRPTSA